MADRSPHGNTGNDTGALAGGERPPGAPLWVKVFGIVAFALVVLFVIVMLVVGGDHGPGRHAVSVGFTEHRL